ncbi:MAG TPA: site-2 protease family protein [Solirubrobacteraceae bacterium]|jgi:Zn-dependent protease
MRVRGSFQLARIFGIRVGVGISWFFVLFLYLFLFTPYFESVLGGSSTTAYLVSVASVLSLFVSLVLHELGHALVARRNGLQVAGIELWALGGITRTSGTVSGPGPEFRIAAAGPLVTLAIVLVSILAGVLLPNHGSLFEVSVGTGGIHATPAIVWLGWIMLLNTLVLILNLVPAFPLDGGQIAHALIWRLTGDRNRATRATGRAGQGFAILLGAGGLALLALTSGSLTGVWLVFIALFVYQAASAAVVQGSVGQRIQALTVADVMDPTPVTIPADVSLIDAQEKFFGRYRWPWFAVVDPARRFLGVVRSERLDAEIAAGRPALQVVDVLEENMPVRIGEDQPLESLLRAEGLGRLGAMVAVDGEGVLRGIVTLAQIRDALRPAPGT